MKKKELKSTVIALNNRIHDLEDQKESNEWKVKLYQDLADSNLQLLGYEFEAEPPIDVTCNIDPYTQYYQTGNFTVTLHLHRPIKKESHDTNSA